MNLRALAVVGMCLLVAQSTCADEADSNAFRLKQALQRSPEADANKDGTLTNEEFRAFRQGKGVKRDESVERAFDPVTDDPALPRVLLIGDSISVGYTVFVREALAGKANVHRPHTNCGNTSKGVQQLDQWLGDGKWNVIHFNFGLHDATSAEGKPEVDFDQYQANLRTIVPRLKKTGAQLIWCSTTPVPVDRRAPLSPEDVVRYNEAARKIMEENGIAIDDLHAFALPQLKDIQLPANVHVTEHGSKVLAGQVAASIEKALLPKP